MKMFKKIIYIGVILIFAGTTRAAAQDVKATFVQAYEAYEAGDYNWSLTNINGLERRLGKTNSKIQSLKALIYNDQGNFKNALLELELYFKTSPDKNSSEYESMSSLYNELKEFSKQKLESDKAEIERKRQADLQEAQESVNAEKDLYYFRVAKQAGTVEAWELFLKKNSTVSLRTEAEKLLKAERDELKYNQLISEGLELIAGQQPKQAVDKFLQAENIKPGTWLSSQIAEARSYSADIALYQANLDLLNRNWEDAVKNLTYVNTIKQSAIISSKLLEASDELAFETALSANDVQAMKNYLNLYSNGRKVSHAQGFLLNHYLEEAGRNIALHNTAGTRAALAEMARLSTTPHWSLFSEDYYKLMLEEARYLSSGNKKHRIKNVPAAIVYYEELNRGSGTDYKNKIRQLRARNKEWNRPEMGFVAFRTDNTMKDVGVMFGASNNRKVGLDISIQAPLQLLSSGTFDNPGQDYLKGTFGMNYSKKIIYPLWVYAGAGYTNFQRVEPSAANSDKYILGEETVDTVNLETGLALNFKPVFLTVNLNMPYLSDKHKATLGLTKTPSYINFGLGFSW